jgi:hypothetical protein
MQEGPLSLDLAPANVGEVPTLRDLPRERLGRDGGMLLVSEPRIHECARTEVLGDPVHGREPTRRHLEASLALTETRLDLEGVLLFGAVVLDDV